MKGHLKEILQSWFSWLIWDADEKWIAKSAHKQLAEELFDKILKNDIKKYFYFEGSAKEAEFVKQRETADKCEYCKTPLSDLKKFYKEVNSATYQRGETLEIERRHCYMETYTKEHLDAQERKEFLSEAEKFFDNFFKELDINNDDEKGIKSKAKKAWDNLQSEEKNKLLLSLPAPYNTKNCCWVCYYCNNAKSDVFTDKQFEPVAEGIGKAIRDVLAEKIFSRPRVY